MTRKAQPVTTHDLQQSANRIVQNEVHLCLSAVIYGLTRYANIPDGMDADTAIELWQPVYEGEKDEEENPMEVFEHWAVSDWLAEKLTEHHERVVEFFDLNVWCRTTTGQGISSDHVIETITREMLES